MTRRRYAFTLGDVVRENARSLPDVEAIVCGPDRLTYRRLDDRVNRTAALLAAAGAARGDRVAWVGHSCHRTIEMLFACAKLAAVLAPVNWRQSADELTWTIRQVAPRVLATMSAPDLAAAVDVARLAAPEAAVLVPDDPGYERRLSTAGPADPAADDDDELPVLEMFTAAFSGRPRGALLSHRGIVSQDMVMAAMRQVEPDEVYLASGPMFHIGVLLKLFATLHLGGRTVIVPRAEPEAVCRAVAAERCTSAFLFTPTIGEITALNSDGRYDLSSLRSVPGRPPREASESWYSMTSCTIPNGSGVTGYGQTETVGMVTFEDRPPAGGTGAFGRPSPMVALRILDEDRREVPDGEAGEIAVRGPQLMLGYHDAGPGPDGWHLTSDLGRRELDGTVSFLGPKLDLIKTGMENVYPAEVENVLRRHPAIADACVIGVPDPVWGQSVRAVVQPRPDAEVDTGEVIGFVRERIASYKKPKSVIVVDALPRSGPAVDRDEVKRRWSGPEQRPRDCLSLTLSFHRGLGLAARQT